MESTRPIRALVRGLDALTTLNQRNGATVSEIAQQIRLPRTTTYRIVELGKEVLWPVAFASLSGTQMLVRETTDHRSPLAIERFSPGVRLPLLTTAAGRAHLAFCPVEQRESLLEILRRSTNEVDKLAHNRPELDKILD